jgi:DNA mismatch repair protein MutL
MSIQILPPDVANQIAAGEVVERPASVVKELLENSVDAGGTDIRVEVRDGGRRLIRIQDNGCGIAAADTAALFQRHATSKISSARDLDHLTTLGFRGEALASIGSVAQVSLLTRTADEEAGMLVRIAAGQNMIREPHGAPPGTSVTVEHLFANVPARFKFLKQAATETGHIFQIVTRYALAYPELRFGLVTDGKLAFQSTGSGKLYDVLVKVYGLDMAKPMLGIEGSSAEGEPASTLVLPSHPPVRVAGYIGAPALHRGNRSYITLFINRRWFQDASLAYGIIQAYHTLLPVGRFPVALVFIEMDPGDVDVNVHPAKAEVRFREGHGVFGAVQRAVRRTLIEHAPIPQVPVGDGPSAPGSGRLTWEQLEAWSARRDALLNAGTGHATILNVPPNDPGGAPAGLARNTEPGGHDPRPAAVEWPEMPGDLTGVQVPVSVDATTQSVPAKIPLLRVVGQLGSTYIVAEGPDGMYLVDQHAAHERILYERMLAAHVSQQVPVQPLLEPVVLDLTPEQAAVTGGALDTLAEWGITLEPFGGQSYLLRSLPAVLNGQNPQSAMAEIADGLAQGVDVVSGTLEARLVTLICKRAAVKGGHVLTMVEMQELVRQLEDCASPRTCPHGRPTMIHVSAADLARQFGRT